MSKDKSEKSSEKKDPALKANMEAVQAVLQKNGIQPSNPGRQARLARDILEAL